MNDQIITAIKEEYGMSGLSDGYNGPDEIYITDEIYIQLDFDYQPEEYALVHDEWRVTPAQKDILMPAKVTNLNISIYYGDKLKEVTPEQRLVILDTLNEIEE